MLRRILSRLAAPFARGGEQHTEIAMPRESLPDVLAEYQAVLESELLRCGIAAHCYELEVRHVGPTDHGFGSFIATIRLTTWDRSSALRLLLGLPLLDRRVRQALRTRWLADVSDFGGLWIQASEQAQSTSAMTELRELLLALTGPSRQ